MELAPKVPLRRGYAIGRQNYPTMAAMQYESGQLSARSSLSTKYCPSIRPPRPLVPLMQGRMAEWAARQ